MVEVELGKYVSTSTVKNGEEGVIATDAKYEELERDGKKKKVLNINIIFDGRTLIYTPNWKVLQTLVDAWGSQTDDWAGNRIKFSHKEVEIAGKEMTVIRATPM